MVLDDKARNEAVDAVREAPLPCALHHRDHLSETPSSQVGLTPGQRKDFDTFVNAIPCVSLDAYCEIEVCTQSLQDTQLAVI